MVKMVSFMLYVLYHNFSNKKIYCQEKTEAQSTFVSHHWAGIRVSSVIPDSVSFHISGILVSWKEARARAVTGCVYLGCEYHDF